RRSVNVEKVAAAAVTGGDHEGLAVHGKSHVAEKCLVENGVDHGLIVDATLRQPVDLGSRSGLENAHDSPYSAEWLRKRATLVDLEQSTYEGRHCHRSLQGRAAPPPGVR